jgi:hypothetical protein
MEPPGSGERSRAPREVSRLHLELRMEAQLTHTGASHYSQI